MNCSILTPFSRGAGSSWFPIEPKVRVSNKAGKVVRVILETDTPVDVASVEISLVHQEGSEWKQGPEFFQLRSKTSSFANGIVRQFR